MFRSRRSTLFAIAACMAVAASAYIEPSIFALPPAASIFGAVAVSLGVFIALWELREPVLRVLRSAVASFARTSAFAALVRLCNASMAVLMRSFAVRGTLHYKAPGNWRMCGST